MVVTTVAIGAVMLAAGSMATAAAPGRPELNRRHVYIDTMGLHPGAHPHAVDIGVRITFFAGTDWPISIEKQIPERLQAALIECGVSAADQQLVAAGNTAKLLGISPNEITL